MTCSEKFSGVFVSESSGRKALLLNAGMSPIADNSLNNLAVIHFAHIDISRASEPRQYSENTQHNQGYDRSSQRKAPK